MELLDLYSNSLFIWGLYQGLTVQAIPIIL